MRSISRTSSRLGEVTTIEAGVVTVDGGGELLLLLLLLLEAGVMCLLIEVSELEAVRVEDDEDAFDLGLFLPLDDSE